MPCKGQSPEFVFEVQFTVPSIFIQTTEAEYGNTWLNLYLRFILFIYRTCHESYIHIIDVYVYINMYIIFIYFYDYILTLRK